LFDIGGVCVVSPFQAILDYEISHGIPPGWINYTISRTRPSTWHLLERNEIPVSTAFYTSFTRDLTNASLWPTFYALALSRDPSLPPTTPPVPSVDGEELFWKMMDKSRTLDPWMYPALLALKESKKYILAALSNTIIFPEEHPYANPAPEKDVRRLFDVFVSSAHVGLRKPDVRIYELALEMVNDYAQKEGKLGEGKGIEAGDVVFLDDIGENLKTGRMVGFRTIKVKLGRAFEAVDELEEVTGMRLAGDHPRVPVLPVVNKKGREEKL
ncbi:HAD-like protein, partial [Mollisia scopiformis]